MLTKLLFLVLFLATAAPVLAQEQEGITIISGTARRATRVRRKPSSRQTVIRRLPANATVRILSPDPRRGFWRVILDHGRQGYVPASDIEIPESALAAARTTASAARPWKAWRMDSSVIIVPPR